MDTEDILILAILLPRTIIERKERTRIPIMVSIENTKTSKMLEKFHATLKWQTTQ